jgi:hypothetical protein
MGLESELALLGVRPLLHAREAIGRALLGAIAETQPHAPGWGAKHRSTLFLANGSAIGLDPPRFVPEVSTPECLDPFTLAAAHRAGLALVAEAAARVGSERGIQVTPAVASTFHQPGEVSLGTHENYGVPTTIEPAELVPAVLTWVVARIILTEPGVVSALPGGSGFALAPRAELMTRIAGPHTTHDRAIFTTCRLNYAGRGWRRLHVIAAGGTASSWAIALRSGVTALLLELVRRGDPWPAALTLRHPLRALRTLSLLPEAPVSTMDGGETTALGLNERLLTWIEAAQEKEPLAAWAGHVLAEWQRGLRHRVLTAFLAGEGVDWRTAQLWAGVVDRLRSAATGQGPSLPRTWAGVAKRVGEDEAARVVEDLVRGGFSPRDYRRYARLVEELFAIDIALARVAGGAGAHLDDLSPEGDRIAPPAAWRQLMLASPEGTRAEVRGRLITRYRDAADLRASWAGVVAGGHVYDLGNPLMTTDPPPRG